MWVQDRMEIEPIVHGDDMGMSSSVQAMQEEGFPALGDVTVIGVLGPDRYGQKGG